MSIKLVVDEKISKFSSKKQQNFVLKNRKLILTLKDF